MVDMTPEQRALWLQRRRGGVGSSDVAAIVGLDLFGKGPLDIYLDKVGLLPERTSPEMSWGLMLEDAIAGAYAQETGYELTPGEHQTGPEPWMLASPDRIARDPRAGPESSRHVVELKKSGSRDGWGAPWTDQVPPHYLLQVQWQLLCTGLQRGDVAATILGGFPTFYTIAADPELQGLLAEAGRTFWDRVRQRRPPDPDWSKPHTARLVELLIAPRADRVVALDAEALLYADRYEALGRNIQDLEREREACKGRLVQALGDASVGLLADGRQVRRTSRVRREKAREAREVSYVDFRIITPQLRSHAAEE
jgi:putative phage-type endonuclease